MELAIPLLALGGMFVVSNQKEKKSNGMTGMSRGSGGGGMGGMKRISAEKAGMSAGAGANTGGTDGFTNMGIRSNLQSANLESRFNNYLPNTVVPAENYPITNNAQLVSTVQEYPNPKTHTSKWNGAVAMSAPPCRTYTRYQGITSPPPSLCTTT